MKTVIYSQRVEIVDSYGERRDCADQNIPLFLQACGYIPVPISNVVEDIDTYVKKIAPVGILLTGGNSLMQHGGNAPERDVTDEKLIQTAIKYNIPLYGFCRGMQSILNYFDCELEQVQEHVAVRHMVQGIEGQFEVNSYHNQACKKVKKPLKVISMTEDGVIEQIISIEHKIAATMWHPEREQPFNKRDMERIKMLFG